MADPIDYDRLSEAIVDALNRSGPGSDATRTAEEVRARQKQIEALLKQTKELKDANGAISTFGRMLTGQKTGFVNVEKDLELLDEQLRKSTRLDERTEIIKRRRELEQAAAYRNVSAAFSNAGIAVTKFTVRLGEMVAQAGADLVRGLQKNGSGIELASNVMIAGLSGVNAVGQGVASGLTGLGQAALGAKSGLMRFGGVGLLLAGNAIGFASDKITRLAKFGVEILTTEVMKNINAFKLASIAGASFANGMDELRQWARAAGLDVEQFAHVIKNNSGALAESGLTVSDGAKKTALITNQFARMTGKSGQSLQREMLNLGYGFQEQAELSAQMLADLKRTGGTATNEQMAVATRDLAKNMRIVADITGQDAKQKLDQAKKASEQYAFFAEVNRIAKQTNDPGLPQRVRASLALMDETQQRAAIQSVVLNGVVTDVSANIYGMADPAREFNKVLRAGNAGVADLTSGFYRASQDFEKNSGATARAISTANIATGQLSDLAKAADIRGQSALYQDPKNLLRAEQNAEAAAGAAGQIHKAVIDAEQEAQRLRLMLQDTLTPVLGKFAEVAAESITVIREAVEALKKSGAIKSVFGGEDKKSEDGPSVGDRLQTGLAGAAIGDIAGRVVGGIVGLITSLFTTGGVGAVPMMMAGQGIGGGIGRAVGGGVGAFWEDIKGWFNKNTARNARGGLTQAGKLNIAGEEGPEAIVPLDSGRSIPVMLKNTNFGKDTDTETAPVAVETTDFNKELGLSTEKFLNPIMDVYRGMLSSVYGIQDIANTSTSGVQEMAASLSKFKDITPMFDNLGNLDTGVLKLSRDLEDLNLVTVKALRDIASVNSKNVQTFGTNSTQDEAFSKAVERLVKGSEQTAEATVRGMAVLADSPRKLAQPTDTDTDDITGKVSAQADSMVQSLQTQLTGLLNDLKDTTNVKPVQTGSQESAMVTTVNENLINALKSTLIQNNEALRSVMQEQTEILRTNTNKIEDLASATSYGADYTRRLYNETT